MLSLHRFDAYTKWPALSSWISAELFTHEERGDDDRRQSEGFTQWELLSFHDQPKVATMSLRFPKEPTNCISLELFVFGIPQGRDHMAGSEVANATLSIVIRPAGG